MMFSLRNTNLSDDGKYELALLMKEEPYALFLPNKPQADFIRAVGTQVPETRIFLVTSGNGTGKTTVTINIIANIVFGNSNVFRNIRDVHTGEIISGFFDYPLYHAFPKRWPRQVWYISNKDSLDGIWKEFRKWIPEYLYVDYKDGKTHVSRVEFPQKDWTLHFKTVDQEPKTFESANVSIAIFDEPPPLTLFKAAIARLRSGGIILIPATPLFGASWFVDEIIDRVDVDEDKYHQTVSVWENCIQKAGQWDLGKKLGIHPKGCLEEKNIAFMVRNFDPDEREAREHGKFQYLSGLVYKTYDQKKHFVKLKNLSDPREYVYQFVLDPHDRRPPAAVWIRIDQWGRRRIIREWPSVEDRCYQGRLFKDIKSADPFVLKDFVRFFCEIEDELKIPGRRLQSIIDPNFGKRPNSVTGMMLYQEYEKAFREQGRPRGFIVDANDDLATGHAAVRKMLERDREEEGSLLIDRSCVNTDWSFRHYCYDDWTGKASEKRDLSFKVKEIGKDFVDLVRYAAVVPCTWRPPDRICSFDESDYGYYESIHDRPGEQVYRGEGADFV